MGILDGLRARLFGNSADPAALGVQAGTPMAPQQLLQLLQMGLSGNSAWKIAVVYGSVRLIASALAQMPLEIRQASGQRPSPGAAQHPLERLWNVEASPPWSGTDMVEWIIAQTILFGNAYVYIERTMRGQIVGLWPQPSVYAFRHGVRNAYTIYPVSISGMGWTMPSGGRQRTVDQDDMLHFHGLKFDGLTGEAAITTGAGSAAATEQAMTAFSGSTYLRGAMQRYAITSDKELKEDQRQALEKLWAIEFGQGLSTAHKPMILNPKWDLKPLTMSAHDLQLIEGREFQISDVLRALGVPGILMNQENKSTSWGTGIEATKAGFLSFTVQEYVSRMEAEIQRKAVEPGRVARLASDRLLRGTPKERFESHRTALGGGNRPGWKSVNEVRIEEGHAPLEDSRYDMPYFPPARNVGGAGAPEGGNAEAS